ncbi:MAG: flagellar biosynthesis protein FlhB [Eubacterium sp.]|nr:flagellar biosynthesis protein FlhB [Eubacterium sp.]
MYRECIDVTLKYDLQWFAKDGPGGEKTEPATDKRLREAREDGKVVKSRELSAAVDLIALFVIMKFFMSFISNGFLESFHLFYNKIPDVITESGSGLMPKMASQLMSQSLLQTIKVAAPFLVAGFLVAFLINIIQIKGIKVTLKPLKPKPDKFNPVNGFKRMFSKNSLFELLKSIMKIVVIAVVAYSSVRTEINSIFILYDMELLAAIILIGNIVINTGLKIALVYLVIGFVDWFYQKKTFDDDMKMTKQEVKEEYKNTEGNPEIKGKQRQRMREASQRRMMQDLPGADVIITNPTHLAVALKYEESSGKAPIVIAKGEDYLAMKIRELAKEHQIDIVENKPLARMLYANVDIGQEIPPELYQSVAEILAMVYQLKNKV